jgi:hypothetical protein
MVFLRERPDHCRVNEDAARQWIRVGSTPVPGTFEVSRLAARTMTANLVLNLDEVIAKK